MKVIRSIYSLFLCLWLFLGFGSSLFIVSLYFVFVVLLWCVFSVYILFVSDFIEKSCYNIFVVYCFVVSLQYQNNNNKKKKV